MIRFYAQVGSLEYAELQDGEYVVDRCGTCDLVFQRNVPDDAMLEKLYERWIDPTQAFRRLHANVTPGRRLEIARDVFIGFSLIENPASPLRALDYGCGWGEWGAMTRAFGAVACGTELSPARRDYCTQLGIEVMADDSLPDGGFDFINADQVFEHLPRPRETLGMLTKKLRPGGILRIAVPNGLRIERALRHFDRELHRPSLGALNPVAPLEHLNCFRTRALVQMGAALGLRRVVPSWRVLLAAMHFPPGAVRKVKAVLRPFYLRSRVATQLFFTPSL